MTEAVPQRTAIKGLLVRGFDGLRTGVLPLAILVFTMREDGVLALFVGLGMVAVVIVASIALSLLGWLRLTYTVGVDDIRVESGLLSRTARSVPYERIQDISLEQKLVPRLLGLVAVKFETGAGAGEDLSLQYLTEDEGERLRELVRERRDDGAAVPAVGAEEQRPDPVLFAMSPQRVLTFGLFNFSLVVMAVVGGLLQQFDAFLPFNPFDFDAWHDVLAGPGTWLAGLGLAAQITGAIVAGVLLLLVGVVSGVVRTALREWNFRLEQTSRGLRRRRGLLTRTDVMLPVHRVQAQTIDTGILMHRFGWKQMSLVSLASDEGSGHHVVAPFAKREELEPILSVTGFTLPDDTLTWHGSTAAFRWHQALWQIAKWVAISAIVAIVQWGTDASGLVGDPRVLLVPLAYGGFSAWREWYRLRFDGLALDARQLHRKGGWLAPHITTATRARLHSVEIVQGPLARRGDYADLNLGLAGGKLAMRGLPLAAARTIAAQLLGSMAAQDFSQLYGDQAIKSAQPGFSENFLAT